MRINLLLASPTSEATTAASQARGEGQGCNLEVGRAAGEVIMAGCAALVRTGEAAPL